MRVFLFEAEQQDPQVIEQRGAVNLVRERFDLQVLEIGRASCRERV